MIPIEMNLTLQATGTSKRRQAIEIHNPYIYINELIMAVE